LQATVASGPIKVEVKSAGLKTAIYELKAD